MKVLLEVRQIWRNMTKRTDTTSMSIKIKPHDPSITSTILDQEKLLDSEDQALCPIFVKSDKCEWDWS